MPLRTAKTFHWPRQIKSFQSLLDRFTPETLQYICPAANTGFLPGQTGSDQAYQRLTSLDLSVAPASTESVVNTSTAALLIDLCSIARG